MFARLIAGIHAIFDHMELYLRHMLQKSPL